MWNEHLASRIDRELYTDDRLGEQDQSEQDQQNNQEYYHDNHDVLGDSKDGLFIILMKIMSTLMITSSMLCISWTVSMLFAFKCFRKALRDHLCP